LHHHTGSGGSSRRTNKESTDFINTGPIFRRPTSSSILSENRSIPQQWNKRTDHKVLDKIKEVMVEEDWNDLDEYAKFPGIN